MDLREHVGDYRSKEFPDSYEDPNGCHWDSASEMLVNSDALLRFCSCGMQTEFAYILGGLELLGDKCPDVPRMSPEFEAWWVAHKARESAHFGNDAAAEFFYKWLDREGLAEHGGSVPGWLTKDGERLLALMREADADDATPREVPHA